VRKVNCDDSYLQYRTTHDSEMPYRMRAACAAPFPSSSLRFHAEAVSSVTRMVNKGDEWFLQAALDGCTDYHNGETDSDRSGHRAIALHGRCSLRYQLPNHDLCPMT
jgi:hypothetical protein